MWKTCQKVLEKVEDLLEVRFVEFKSAIESVPVVFADFEVEFFEVWNAVIHTLNHLVLELEKSRVVERDDPWAGNEVEAFRVGKKWSRSKWVVLIENLTLKSAVEKTRGPRWLR